MPFLMDANLLLRNVQADHPMHLSAVEAIRRLSRRGDKPFLVPQNFYEFWNVATRPLEKNGLGWTPEEAEEEVKRLQTLFTVLYDSEAVYREWLRLVSVYSIRGVSVHDARLVAAMRIHGLTHILTFNVSDFTRYAAEITA